MFPDDIKKVALVAIKNKEFKTLNYLLNDLSGWMDSPDKSTADAAISIGDALSETDEYKTNLSVVQKVHDLYSYAVRACKYFEAQTVSA